jgi:hypothetical protein
MQLDKIKSSVRALLPKPKKGGDDSLWPYIRDLRMEGEEARRPYERQWLLNLAFLSGKQYAYYNQGAEKVQQVKTQKGRVRVIDNKILPRYRKQVARMLRSDPVMTVIPASASAEDIRAAKIGSKVLKNFWRQDRMRVKRRMLANWIYATGNGFLEDKWNTRLGPISLDSEGNAVYEGDVECPVWSPFEVVAPAYGFCNSSVEEMPWVILSRFYTLEDIQTKFPKRGKEVTPEERPGIVSDASTLFGLQTTSVSRKQEGAVVSLLRLKPNATHKKGLYAFVANGIVLEQGDYPFESFHLEHFKDIEIPGVFWGMATSEGGIWLQKIHNRTLSDVVEHNRVMARGKWLIPRKAKLETAIDDSIGQTLLYNPVMGAKPEMLTLKGLPNSYILALDLVAKSFMELYSQHEVSQGTNKSDIRSGTMVQLLLEQDAEGSLPTHAVFEEALQGVMTRVLRRIKEGYTTERIVSVSEGSSDEVLSFKGLELRNSKDVIIARDSSIADSKVGRQAQTMERFTQGLYGDPRDPAVKERILIMLDEVPDTVQDIYGETHLDRQNAQMENAVIREDPTATVLVNAYDNHRIHLEEHHRARKDRAYQGLRFSDPQSFWIFEAGFMQHEVQHQTFVQEERRRQMEEMALMKGGAK